MQTAANPTPRALPEFLTGRPMQSRENPVSQDIPNNESMNKTSIETLKMKLFVTFHFPQFLFLMFFSNFFLLKF